MTNDKSLRSTISEGRSVSVSELADHLGICTVSVRAAIDKGEIRSTRLGRIIRIPADEAARLLGFAQPETRPQAA